MKEKIIDLKRGKDGSYSVIKNINEDKENKEIVKIKRKLQRPRIERIVYRTQRKNPGEEILDGFQQGLDILQKFIKFINKIS